MGVLLSVDGSEPVQDLTELAEWLNEELELRGLISQAFASPDAAEMGTLPDVLVAAVGAGGAVSVLVSSLKTFLLLMVAS